MSRARRRGAAALAALGVVLALAASTAATRPTVAAWQDPVYARAQVEVVAGTADVRSLSAGDGYTCAVVDGTVWCWGRGADGVLGDGGTADAPTPVAVTGGALAGRTATSVAAGSGRTCAAADGAASCWGAYVLGDFDPALPYDAPQSSVPVAVYDAPAGDGDQYESPLYGRTVVGVAAGATVTCGRATDGTAACWGPIVGLTRPSSGPQSWANAPVPVPTTLQDPTSQLPPGAPVTQITAGTEFGCVIAAGSLYCWGRNQQGEVGNGTAGTPARAPQAVDATVMPAGTVTDVSQGVGHTCAVSDDRAYCWGIRAAGALGDGLGPSGTQNTPSPVAFGPDVTVVDVAAGGEASCAVVATGDAYCWGRNTTGVLGVPSVGAYQTVDTPQPVDRSLMPAGVLFTSIAVGTGHACAGATDGNLYCWGQGVALGSGATSDTVQPQDPVAAVWAAP